MSARHTEGPWIIRLDEWSERNFVITSRDREERGFAPIAEIDTHFTGPHGVEQKANLHLILAAPALLAALEAQVEADRLSGIYQTYADAPAHASDADYDSRCDEMHAAWMQAQDLAEKLRESALTAARGDGKGEG